jgi:uncharacterized protein (TIGR02453 family)
MVTFDLNSVLRFAADLKIHNNREWFLEHRSQYETARTQFENYISALIGELSFTEPLADISAKDCIFRLNRDLRFTKDKMPYKPYLSAYIAPGGRKSSLLGYYVHLEPGNAMLAGGMYDPNPQQLANWRESINRSARLFKEITSDATFMKYFGHVTGERLKTAPRGYSEDHPEIDLLRLKSVTVMRKVTDAEVTAPSFFQESMDTFNAMKPFLQYLDSIK